MKMFFFALAMIPLVSFAGNDRGGGGDLCENRIQIIRDDLKSWLLKGGAKGLKLPGALTPQTYTQTMLTEIGLAKISCVSKGDPGHPVMVKGTPKICVFNKGASESRITCDHIKLLHANESEQYTLIHHEYAGLANVEVPVDDKSNYYVSNQISGFLEDQIVKKLTVRRVTAATNDGWRMLFGTEAEYLDRALTDSIKATTFADCNINLKDQSLIEVDLLDNNNGQVAGSKKTSFALPAPRYPNSMDDFSSADLFPADFPGEYRRFYVNVANPAKIKSEFARNFSNGSKQSLTITFTTDAEGRILEKVGFHTTHTNLENVGTILKPLYKAKTFVGSNFECVRSGSSKSRPKSPAPFGAVYCPANRCDFPTTTNEKGK